MFLLLSALLSLAPPSFADTPITLVPVSSGHQGKSATVSTGGAAITPDAFAAAVLDGDHYPMSATYGGVKALLECRTLEKRADGSVIVYQRTGGNFAVASRHYVLALKVKSKTATSVTVEWNLVDHKLVDGKFEGPFASALNAHPEAVYTPYNHGAWKYDQTSGNVTYTAESDPGGTIPSFMVGEGAVMAFPLELLKVKWGIVPQ